MTLDLGTAFRYIFQDSNWVMKMVIAALMVPLILVFFIGAFILNGYVVETVRRVMRDDPNPLPEWTDFGNYLIRGLIATVGLLIWFIPLIVVSCCLGIFLGIGFGDSDAGGIVSNFFVSLISAVYTAVVAPLVLSRFAMTYNFNSMFEFDAILSAVPRVGANFLALIIVNIIANFVIPISIIAFCVGIFFAIAYFALVNAHLYGQVGKLAYGSGVDVQDAPAF